MELDTNAILLDLVKGQEKTQQLVQDMNISLFGGDGRTGAIPYIQKEHKELSDRVSSVEKKIYWFSGVGTAVGSILSAIAYHFKH